MDDPKHLIDQADTDPTPPGSLVPARSTVPAGQDAANDDNFLRETPTLADLPQLPREFRLVSLERLALPDHRYQMTAVIFHERASLRVTWAVRQPDTRMKPGMLVEVRWTGGVPRSVMGAVVISRLVLIERHRKIDLFKTVPSTWVKDKTLCRRASMLWRQLTAPCQELISAIFWEGERFARFCAGPSSCRGHHREWGGNFRHAVETAEAALALLPQFPNAHASLAITAALLHDAGKSEDYIYEEGYGNRLSDWGRLVSHRPTVTFWLGEAHRQLKHRIPDVMLQSLLHALNATRAPAHYGLREPVTPEAILLSFADRASGVGDLVAKTAGTKGNWGTKHSHLNGNAPYTI
jgi:3'-5' exoribonuclease